MGPDTQPFDYAMWPASRQIAPASPERLAGGHHDGLTFGMRVTKFEHASLTLTDTAPSITLLRASENPGHWFEFDGTVSYSHSYSDRNWHTQAYAYAPGGTLTEASPDSATATVRPGHQ